MIFDIHKKFGSWLIFSGSLLLIFASSYTSSLSGVIYVIFGAIFFLADPALHYLDNYKNKKEHDLKYTVAYAGIFASLLIFYLRSMIHVPVEGSGYGGILRNFLLFIFLAIFVFSTAFRMLLYFISDAKTISDKTNMDNRRRFMMNTLYSVFTALLLFLFVNYITAVKNPTLDLSPGYFSFGENSRTIIRSLDRDVQVYAFLPVQQASASRNRNTSSPALYRIAEDVKVFLEQLPVINGRIKVDFINADLDGPQLADFPSAGNGTIIFRSSNRDEAGDIMSKTYNERTLRITTENDMETIEKETVRLLIQVSSQSKKICMTALNGEKQLENSSGKILAIDGMDAFKNLLTYFNFNIISLDQRSGWPGSVPEDCNVLFIAGPVVPFSDQAKTTIRDYLKKGGRAFITVDAAGKEDFLWLTRDLLKSSFVFKNQTLTSVKSFPGIPITDFFTKHRITENLTGLDKSIVVFPSSGYYETDAKTLPKTEKKDDEHFASPVFTDIVKVSSGTFTDRNKNGVKDAGENSGNYILGFAVENEKQPLLALYSGTGWITNAGMGFPIANKNGILAVDTLFWMTESKLAAEIPPEKRNSRSVQVTDDLKFRNMMLGMVVFPLLTILFSIGGVYYYRKRRTGSAS